MIRWLSRLLFRLYLWPRFYWRWRTRSYTWIMAGEEHDRTVKFNKPPRKGWWVVVISDSEAREPIVLLNGVPVRRTDV